MSRKSWHFGAPPAPGWWPTQFVDTPADAPIGYRWWDGRAWSLEAYDDINAIRAGLLATIRSEFGTSEIMWRDWVRGER